MRSDNILFFLRTLGFSALAGMRSMSPPALLSLYLARNPPSAKHALARRMASTTATRTFVSLALGEIAADKFPQAPNRTFFPALIGRAITGGGASGLLWSLHKWPAWLGAAVGAGAAVGNTYLTFYLRRWLGQTLPLPYAISLAGVLEDAVVWLGGWWLLKASEKEIAE